MEMVKYNDDKTWGSKSYIYIERHWWNPVKHSDWWEKVGEELVLSDYNECLLMGEIARMRYENGGKESDDEPYISGWRLTKKTITTETFSTSRIWNK